MENKTDALIRRNRDLIDHAREVRIAFLYAKAASCFAISTVRLTIARVREQRHAKTEGALRG